MRVKELILYSNLKSQREIFTGGKALSCFSMEKVEDYNELERLEKIEGRKVLVLYSNLIYRVINGKWEVVGKIRRVN